MEIDHIVVTAGTLDAGARAVEEALGVPMQAGGAHELMGTHNRLLSLGPSAYLEVIAIDPEAQAPGRPRWFGLDTAPAEARLTAWAARTGDMTRALAEAPMGMGEVTELSRGDLEWQMAIPPSGEWPFEGVMPALLSWTSDMPQGALEDRGCTLQRLVLVHPRMGDIAAAWPGLAAMDRVATEVGPQPALRAEIATPDGLKVLSGLIEA